MANIRPPAPPPPRARAVAAPSGIKAAPRRSWMRIDRSPIPPMLRAVFDQCVVAGPVFGVLSALYAYHLNQVGAPAFDVATHEIVRQTQSWHGHMLRAYYITPGQNTLSWVLAVPAIAWAVMLPLTIVALGVRSHYARRSRQHPR